MNYNYYSKIITAFMELLNLQLTLTTFNRHTVRVIKIRGHDSDGPHYIDSRLKTDV